MDFPYAILCRCHHLGHDFRSLWYPCFRNLLHLHSVGPFERTRSYWRRLDCCLHWRYFKLSILESNNQSRYRSTIWNCRTLARSVYHRLHSSSCFHRTSSFLCQATPNRNKNHRRSFKSHWKNHELHVFPSLHRCYVHGSYSIFRSDFCVHCHKRRGKFPYFQQI